MNKQFKKHIESLVPSFEALLAMPPVMVDKLPHAMPAMYVAVSLNTPHNDFENH